jgi:hypothetical protein
MADNRESEQTTFSANVDALLQSKVAARAEGIKARHSNVVQIAARIVSLPGVTLFSAANH